MRGVILASGRGSRLHPLTTAIPKPLLPVFDKPMIYYPLALLMEADIHDICIVVQPRHMEMFSNLLGDGGWLGINIEYCLQQRQEGVVHALLQAAPFCGDEPVALAFGDNVLYGLDLAERMRSTGQHESGAIAFAHPVDKPERFGIAETDAKGRVVAIIEKPEHPRSNLAVIGLYFYDQQVMGLARELLPVNDLVEITITDLNNRYLQRGELDVELLGNGYSWFDTGTPDDLLNAGSTVRWARDHGGEWLGCVEEVAYRKGWIDHDDLMRIASESNARYAKALVELGNKLRVIR